MSSPVVYRSRAAAILRRSLVASVLLIAGCGKSNVGTVTGTVTVDGSPAKSGSIAFFPTNRKSPTAGAEILDGRYAAQVALGVSKVEIRVSKVIGHKRLYNTPNSPVQPLLAEVLPPKYNDESTLTLKVEPGKNEQDYQLTTH